MPTQPTPEELCAIEACREAGRRYTHGVDRLDAAWMKSAYWPDAIDDHGSFVGNAHEFVDHCITSHNRWAWTMCTTYNHSVDVEPGGMRARGEAYNVSYMQRRETGELDIWFGRYLDVYEKRADEWRILERVCVHEGDRTEPAGTPMGQATAQFRSGDFDRPSSGRPLGP